MSQLEPSTVDDREQTDDVAEIVIDEQTDATVSIPADATVHEAAAIATVVGAHLDDRQRAAVAAAADNDSPDYADQWVLADRMHSHGKRQWPREVERGNEWRAAARSF